MAPLDQAGRQPILPTLWPQRGRERSVFDGKLVQPIEQRIWHFGWLRSRGEPNVRQALEDPRKRSPNLEPGEIRPETVVRAEAARRRLGQNGP